MISSKKEYLNCKIKENVQKIEIYNLTSNNNKKILVNHLKHQIIRFKAILSKIKENEVD